MKKVLAIVLTLTLVFALAISSSAATLASTWTALDYQDVDSAGQSEGDITVNGDGSITFGLLTGWWSQAGIKYGTSITADGVEVVVNAKAFTDASPNGYFAIALSKTAIGDFYAADGTTMLGIRTWNPVGPSANSAIFTVYGTELKVWLDGAIGSADIGAAGITSETDFTVKFFVEDDALKIKINGNTIQVYDDDAGVNVDIAYPAADVLDGGKAYLSLFGTGYGTSGSENITVKTINGQAANDFDPSTSGPADIEVIAIAAAMLVALAGAAFVVKARA